MRPPLFIALLIPYLAWAGDYPVLVGGISGKVLTNQVTLDGFLPYYLTQGLLAMTNRSVGTVADAKTAVQTWNYPDSNCIAWKANFYLRDVRGVSAVSQGYYKAPTNAAVCADCLGARVYRISLISPIHYVAINHVTFHAFFSGQAMARFLDTNNVVHWAYSMGHMQIPSGVIDVGILDRDMSAAVGYVRMFPTNVHRWFRPPDYRIPQCNGYSTQCVMPNQDDLYFMGAFEPTYGSEQKATVYGAWMGLGPNTPCLAGVRWTLDGGWYTGDIHGGDSSDPIYCVLDGELVLVGLLSGGEDIQKYIPEINVCMAQLSAQRSKPVYEVETVDLSRFTRQR